MKLAPSSQMPRWFRSRWMGVPAPPSIAVLMSALYKTELDELIYTCVWSYCAMLRLFDTAGRLSSDGGGSFKQAQASFELRVLAEVGFPVRQFLRSSFCILPKHHFVQHALDEAKLSLVPQGFSVGACCLTPAVSCWKPQAINLESQSP